MVRDLYWRLVQEIYIDDDSTALTTVAKSLLKLQSTCFIYAFFLTMDSAKVCDWAIAHASHSHSS